MTKEELIERIQENHRHHSPQTKERIEAHSEVRAVTAACAMCLVELCPVSRELSLALTAMEEAMMWANAALARSEDSDEPH